MWVILIILIFIILVSWNTMGEKNAHKTKTPYSSDIERKTLDNNNYRQVEYTTPFMQLVLMSIPTGQDIGMETHPKTTQFVRVEDGEGVALMDNKEYHLKDNTAIVIPPNTPHNIISKKGPLKLYSLYSPPEHHPLLYEPNKGDRRYDSQ